MIKNTKICLVTHVIRRLLLEWEVWGSNALPIKSYIASDSPLFRSGRPWRKSSEIGTAHT